jgi:hypothetical protein
MFDFSCELETYTHEKYTDPKRRFVLFVVEEKILEDRLGAER